MLLWSCELPGLLSIKMSVAWLNQCSELFCRAGRVFFGRGRVQGKRVEFFARIRCWLLNKRQHLVLVNSLSDLFEYFSVNNLDVLGINKLSFFFCPNPLLIGQQEHHTACHLSVQTRGNLSPFLNTQVKCVVVGSLVTTHRMFKGLLLLNRSPLAKPIINPSYNDFCPRDLVVASENAVSPAHRSDLGMTKWAFGSHEYCETGFVPCFSEMVKCKQRSFRSTEALGFSELDDCVGRKESLFAWVFLLCWYRS